jgi:hypothetical protein
VRKFSFRTAAVAIAFIAMLGLNIVVASPAVAGVAPFAAQAQQLGLTAAEATDLQYRVDDVVAKTGGVQVAINKISIKGGDMLVTLPGEARARDLDGSSTARAGDCPFYYFCYWQYENWTGTQLRAYYCNQDYYVPWSTYGSYTNAQSAPGIATFKDVVRRAIGTSCRPLCQDNSIHWAPIYYIDPC